MESINASLHQELQSCRTQLEVECNRADHAERELQHLQDQFHALQLLHRDLESSSTVQTSDLKSQLCQCREENKLLHAETDAAVQRARKSEAAFSAASAEVDSLREAEAALVNRVEDAEAMVAQLSGQNATLQAEAAMLLKQRDHHINHAELLMKEKNRYFAMLTDMKRRHAAECEDKLGPQQPSRAASIDRRKENQSTAGAQSKQRIAGESALCVFFLQQ